MSLTKEEKNLILEETRVTNEFDYVLFLVLSTTGRRIGELYGVEDKKEVGRKVIEKKGKRVFHNGKWYLLDKTVPRYQRTNKWRLGVQGKDIDFQNNTMRVWVLKRGRPEQDETVLLPYVSRVLYNYMRRNRIGLKDHVFRRAGRKYRNINDVLRKYAVQAGVPTFKTFGDTKKVLSVHSFRHYFITELKRQGWTNEKIMVLTGHKKSDTLQIYSHVLAKDIRADAEQAIRAL